MGKVIRVGRLRLSADMLSVKLPQRTVLTEKAEKQREKTFLSAKVFVRINEEIWPFSAVWRILQTAENKGKLAARASSL